MPEKFCTLPGHLLSPSLISVDIWWCKRNDRLSVLLLCCFVVSWNHHDNTHSSVNSINCTIIVQLPVSLNLLHTLQFWRSTIVYMKRYCYCLVKTALATPRYTTRSCLNTSTLCVISFHQHPTPSVLMVLPKCDSEVSQFMKSFLTRDIQKSFHAVKSDIFHPRTPTCMLSVQTLWSWVLLAQDAPSSFLSHGFILFI